MAFESFRAYVQLASGLTDLTRARAMEAAQGLLALPATGIATGTKMASQAGALADELLAAATANRSELTTLIRTEVDAAIMTRLGLVPVQKLQEAEAEAAHLRAEVARLRSASSTAAPKPPAKKGVAARRAAKTAPAKSTARGAAPRSAAKKAVPAKSTAKRATPAKSTAKRATPAKSTAKGAAPDRSTAEPASAEPAITAPTAGPASGSAVTTRATPAGT